MDHPNTASSPTKPFSDMNDEQYQAYIKKDNRLKDREMKNSKESDQSALNASSWPLQCHHMTIDCRRLLVVLATFHLRGRIFERDIWTTWSRLRMSSWGRVG